MKASSSNDEDFDDMVDQVLDSMATEDSHMNVNGVDPYADPEANDISDPDITKLYSVETIEKFLKVPQVSF